MRAHRRALLFLSALVVVVYARLFSASFVEYDDDIHVYANPALNPPSWHGLADLWRHAYHGLYNPLAYTIWAALAAFARAPIETTTSLGQAITLDPFLFHATSVALHLANTLLAYLLALKLCRQRTAALLAAVVFAVHPLQVESVGWISELRGLSSASFVLGALNLLVQARRTDVAGPTRPTALLASAAALVTAAMLCKPAAVAAPLVALVIDRAALGTPWRRSLVTASTWALCVLPFAIITRIVQKTYPEGVSFLWQRPFVAGDALAFYLFKAALPLNLGVEYGRTPQAALSEGSGYLTWVVPVGLLAFAFLRRTRRPLAWLGALLFCAFLLPTSGLVPFAFQAHSTVADRYAYLPMLGVGLVVADLVSAVATPRALRVAGAALVVLAIRAFDQTSHWLDNDAFLEHTIDVNPDVAFAQNNLANKLFEEKRYEAAIAHFEKALAHEPDHALAQNNLGLALVQVGRLEEAEPHFKKAVAIDPQYYKAHESLGSLYLRTNRFADAIKSLQAAVSIKPSEAKAFNDLGIAFMRSGQPNDGIDAFERAVALEPSAQYRKNLGTALAQVGRAEDAARYLAP